MAPIARVNDDEIGSAHPGESTIHRSVVCPGCGLLCDDLEVAASPGSVRVVAHGCPKSERFFSANAASTATINGRPVAWREAVDEAARILREAKHPLLLSAGADVAAMRALLELGERTGAVVDHADSDALFRNLLVLQDGGWISTTLTEVRNRADLLIAAGTDIATRFPRFFERCFGSDPMFVEGNREAWFIGSSPPSASALIPSRTQAIEVPRERLGDVFGALRALATGEPLLAPDIAGVPAGRLQQLTDRMRSSRYGVVTWAAADLEFQHAELSIQSMCEWVRTLNASGRFAVLPLGMASDMTAMQTCTWQTGYPLRTSFAARAPAYDPILFSGKRLLQQNQVDALLTVSALDADRQLPETTAPSIVLGRGDAADATVFIPVAAPGLHHPGHLFRTDSVVALRLRGLVSGSWPSAASALTAIGQGLHP